MATTAGPTGYVQFSTPVAPRAKKRYRDYLHQWVLWAFVGPAKPGQVTRHLNDVRTDNRLENLVWGSYSDNQYDIRRNNITPHKSHCKRGHALVGENLAPGRRCRTCQRGRAAARRKGVAYP